MTSTPPARRIDNTETTKNLCHWIFSGALGLVFLTEIIRPTLPAGLEAALLLLAVLASITSLSRQIPLQNVLLGVGIAAFIGGLAHGLSALRSLGMPFGPIFFHETCGSKLFDTVPWPMPLIWVVALFSSRGTARVILRPWRKLKSYGYWLIGLTAILVTVFDAGLEPYATVANHFWSWQATKIPFSWYGASPLNFISWGSVSLLILAFATPALIKKKPGSRTPLDLSPLAIWLGALVIFAAGCARVGVWPAVAVDGSLAVVVLALAIPGARW